MHFHCKLIAELRLSTHPPLFSHIWMGCYLATFFLLSVSHPWSKLPLCSQQLLYLGIVICLCNFQVFCDQTADQSKLRRVGLSGLISHPSNSSRTQAGHVTLAAEKHTEKRRAGVRRPQGLPRWHTPSTKSPTSKASIIFSNCSDTQSARHQVFKHRSLGWVGGFFIQIKMSCNLVLTKDIWGNA